MKYTLILSILFLSITSISCLKNAGSKDIILSSDTLITKNTYTLRIIPDSKYKDLYLQIFYKSTKFPHYNSQVIKLISRKNEYSVNFKIDDSCYYMKFDITNGLVVIEDYTPLQKLIIQKDSNFSKEAYYEMIINSQSNNYYKIFNICRQNFPKDLGAYLIKWYFEGQNNLANKKQLTSELQLIEENYEKNGDYFLILTIGYKLLNNKDKFFQYFNNLSKSTTNLLNNDYICTILNDVLNTRIDKSLENNIYKDFVINLMNNNKFTFFTERKFSTLISNDIKDVKLINEFINRDNYNYYNLLLKKYFILIMNNIKDSVQIINNIDNKFDYAYKNLLEIYKEGKNCSFGLLPNKQIYLEFKYVKFNKLKEYNKVVETLLEQIENTNKSEISLISSNFERISDVYQNNLYNLDSSLLFLVKAYDLNTKNQKIKNKITLIKHDYFNSQLDLDLWLDSIRLEYKKIKSSSKINKSNLEIMFENERTVNLNSPNKNIILFFYSTTCGPCKIIFDQVEKNRDLLKKMNVEVIYISIEKVNEIREFLHNKKINFDIAENSTEIYKHYGVIGVPVVILINQNGKLLNRQNGVSEQWKLDETLKLYF